ncbi:MAG: amidohydrolase family protein [Planctomycetes bacterium]|nr:amidohydrolase family protein [Planctomycetota bacterium]
MNKFNFFDAFCTTGRHLKSKSDDPFTPSDLLKSMDRTGISEALVIDCLSREHHPAAGNRRILDEVSDHPRLHPAWSALPHGSADEQPEPEELIAEMRKHKVGALFLFPVQYGFTLSDWAVDVFIEPLAEAGVPVFINFNDNRNKAMDSCQWPELVQFCRRWPSLPVILTEYRIRGKNRLLYRAFDACESLHIELSGYWLYRGIEYLVQHWGPERLIFGSNWPYLNQSCTAATVSMAELDEDDRRLVAGDNLRRLINWCEPEYADVEIPEPEDEFCRFAQSGDRPDNMTFLDCHGHLGGLSPEYHIPDGEVARTVGEMERMGVQKACVFSFSVVHSDERYENDVVADAVSEYPERFVGFVGINPHRGRENVLEELKRGEEMGLRGIKLIPHYQGVSPESPVIDACCEWADERRWIVLSHNWGGNERLAGLLEKYTEMCFIAGHANVAYGPLARGYENLRICTCPVHTPGSCERLVEAAGADRVLFGSDLQDLPISWGLGPVLQADLSVGEKRMILHDNLKQIFSKYTT